MSTSLDIMAHSGSNVIIFVCPVIPNLLKLTVKIQLPTKLS